MADGFTHTFTAGPDDIDELGHVNNAVWVRWIQDVATLHWNAVARAEDVAAYIWVVIRHEIDYRGNIGKGETATGRTWIPDEPKGARFDRRVDFEDESGRTVVSARTTWALLDRETGRPVRIRAELTEPFLGA